MIIPSSRYLLTIFRLNRSLIHIKLFGVQIDQKLTWNKHIDTVALKIAQNLGTLFVE